MRSFANLLRQLGAALRMLLALTVIVGVAYPLLITGIVQIPGLRSRADGSEIAASSSRSRYVSRASRTCSTTGTIAWRVTGGQAGLVEPLIEAHLRP